MTVTFDPFTLSIYSVSAVMRSNCVSNLSEIAQSAAELLRFQYLTVPNCLEHCVTCCAALWDITKFELGLLIRYVTL